MQVTTANIVAEIARSLGYGVTIWEDYEIFGTKYKFVQVNPIGVMIDIPIDGSTVIAVGAEFNNETMGYSGGTKLDIADPKFTPELLQSTIKKTQTDVNVNARLRHNQR